MPALSHSQSAFLSSSRILIENAINIPEVSQVLGQYGYNPERLAQGQQLLNDAEALVQKQTKEYGESHEATQSFNSAWDAANAAYMKTLKIARIVFGKEAKANTVLKLNGVRKKTTAGWLEQAGAFYTYLLSDADLAERMSKFGYSQQDLTAESLLVEEVKKSLQLQAKESGEAQQATVARDKKIAELDTWMSEIRGVARVAFAHDSQALEKLGIVVLNAPRAKKKTTDPIPEQGASAPAAGS